MRNDFNEVRSALYLLVSKLRTIHRTIDGALDGFRDALAAEQRARFLNQSSKPKAEAVLIFTAQLDEANARHNRQCISSRVSGFLDSVQQFTRVIDTLVSSHPDPAALIWGSIRFTLLVSNSILKSHSN